MPGRMASGWLGRDARRGPVKIAVRAVGVRDIAVSTGTLVSLRDRDALRLWIAAAILSDIGDVAATALTSGAALPRNARRGTIALGGGSAAAGLALLRAGSR